MVYTVSKLKDKQNNMDDLVTEMNTGERTEEAELEAIINKEEEKANQ